MIWRYQGINSVEIGIHYTALGFAGNKSSCLNNHQTLSNLKLRKERNNN